MSSTRKYSRSRSPEPDRSNKRKHDTVNNHHRSGPYEQRKRSRDRYDNYRHDRRSYGSRDSRSSLRDADHLPYKGDERRSEDDRHTRTRRRSRSRIRSDSRNSGEADRDAPRPKELEIRVDSQRDFGRLKTTPSSPNGHAVKADGESKELKAEAGTSGPRTEAHGRRSRFDKPASIPTQPAVNGASVVAAAHTISRQNDVDIRSDNGTFTARSNPVESEKKIVTPVLDDDKARLLKERQEKLAQWKKRKAEQSIKQTSTSSTKASGFAQTFETGTRLSSVRSAETRIGIAKFDTQSKSVNVVIPNKVRPAMQFVDDQEEAQTARHSVRDRLTTMLDNQDDSDSNIRSTGIQSTEQETEADEIDPLDAFMAENTIEMKKYNAGNSLAGQVMNKHESDEEVPGDVEDEDILAMAARKAAAKKKDLATVDHAKQDYEPFRKDFYVEPSELSELNEAEVDLMRLELDGILIRGKDCPKPMTNWGQCGLSAPALEQIQRLGYDKPTSIQAQAIPAIMSGRDTIGVAKTGSGKTMAFLLPMFRHIKDQRPLEVAEGPIAIILTPTRELAIQIHKECKPFLKALDLRALCVYGGGSFQDQIADVKRGAEIVVCTPGRMIDILAANQGRVTNLRRVTYTVLDEADRMFDLGFEPQVMKILNNIRPQRQTVLFSATFPKSMEALARKVLRGRPVEITVGARSVVAPEIEQKVEVRPRDPDPQKFNRVLEILGELYNADEDARTLIFVDRQEAADSLLSQLMRKGYPCNALHGGKDQSDRASTISDFKAGIFPILVATSIAARGLDVKQLKLVINYDCPNHMEDYVHRVGRTGRAGNKGTAITFVSEDQERYAFDIAKALRLSQVDVPAPLKVLADAFDAKVKSGQEKSSASGFGGKGLAKFDTLRDQEKRTQRRLYGEEDGVVDDRGARKADADDDDDAEEENDRVNPEEVRAIAESGTSASADAPIKVERVTAQMKSTTGPKVNVGTRALNAMEAARARAEALNNRIKTGAKTLEQVASNPDAGEYRAMMEINDYPQKARWNVTNRTNIAKVLEATGTSITTQGQYVKPGSSAPAGVPKLYLLVEGPTELCVTDAVKELRRLLSEGAASDAEASGGRYSVV